MGASETPTAERYEVAILEKRLAARHLRNNGPAERDRQLPVSAAPRDPGRSDPERDPPLNSTLLSNHLLGLTNVPGTAATHLLWPCPWRTATARSRVPLN